MCFPMPGLKKPWPPSGPGIASFVTADGIDHVDAAVGGGVRAALACGVSGPWLHPIFTSSCLF